LYYNFKALMDLCKKEWFLQCLEHPKLRTIGIGLAITLSLGLALGIVVEAQQAHAMVRYP
jgi:hypothetical protein